MVTKHCYSDVNSHKYPILPGISIIPGVFYAGVMIKTSGNYLSSLSTCAINAYISLLYFIIGVIQQ